MQMRFFTIPVFGGESAADELNRFLVGSRVVAVDRHLVQAGNNSAWAFCISYEASGDARPVVGDTHGRRVSAKVDYREVLNEDDFAVYAKLRALRKALAEKEGVPAYAVFTNEQMAEMVLRRAVSVSTLREIPGVGESRVEKYAEAFLAMLRESFVDGPLSQGEKL
ncbi:MAG: HRDC domain-containing protein [Usitatibacteraceae bacterium]